MTSIQEHLGKLREERMAREKARIEKLRQFNINKYGKSEQPMLKTANSNTSVNIHRTTKPDTLNKSQPGRVHNAPIKNAANNLPKRPLITNLPVNKDIKPINGVMLDRNVKRLTSVGVKLNNKPATNKSEPNLTTKTANGVVNKEAKNYVTMNKDVKRNVEKNSNRTINFNKNAVTNVKGTVERIAARKPMSAVAMLKSTTPNPKETKKVDIRKTMSSISQSATKPNPSRQSVFERLYQPKSVVKKTTTEADKLKSDPSYLKKVLNNTGLILNRRQTTFEPRKPLQERKPAHIRRSISAVHFKRINKSELSKCIHKWASIGEKIDEIDIDNVKEPAQHGQYTSAVKSERKRVKFLTPSYLNTPTPDELKARLQKWLQKRGKSINTYQHLQCFGLHHLPKQIEPLKFDDRFTDEDENKENVPVDSDSDNESYDDNMNKDCVLDDVFEDCRDDNKWKRRSYVSESPGLNETQDSALTGETGLSTPAPAEIGLTPAQVENSELFLGVLNDITELIREGYDCNQAAAWLRLVCARWSGAPRTASYWEARAALEDRRGSLPAALSCWDHALRAGVDKSVVEASLEPLLSKFMQLNISPRTANNNTNNICNNKMVDVKNIFKSTIIRFAVQQAKIRSTSQTEPKYICTPVRRSGRLSTHETPSRLRVCATVKQATEGRNAVFVPNQLLAKTP